MAIQPTKQKSKTAIPADLKNFDSLPDAAHIRAPVVAGLYDCSVNTVWRWAKDGSIPKPMHFGLNHTAWNVGELRRALELRARK